jgi:hypothetical protein
MSRVITSQMTDTYVAVGLVPGMVRHVLLERVVEQRLVRAARAEELLGGPRARDLHHDGGRVRLVEHVVREPGVALPRVHRPQHHQVLEPRELRGQVEHVLLLAPVHVAVALEEAREAAAEPGPLLRLLAPTRQRRHHRRLVHAEPAQTFISYNHLGKQNSSKQLGHKHDTSTIDQLQGMQT